VSEADHRATSLLITPPEVLKAPLKTSVSVSTEDFDDFDAREKLHIVISVKDFKSIVSHAAITNASISAYYSQPGRPLQFTYTEDGMTSNFTLMTAGDYGDTPAPSADASTATTRQASRAPSVASTSGNAGQQERKIEMPPPARPDPRRASRKLGQAKVSRVAVEDHDSLFVPADDDDARWDPPDYEQDEESMGWDASIQPVRLPQEIHLDSADQCSGRWISANIPRYSISVEVTFNRYCTRRPTSYTADITGELEIGCMGITLT
jgi:cell cycle checkpoint control protein RAD9A